MMTMFPALNSSSWLPWLPYLSFGLLPLAVMYDIAGTMDLLLLFGFILLRNWVSVLQVLENADLRPFLGIVKGAAIAFGLTQITKLFRKSVSNGKDALNSRPKPLFFPSRTTHTRIFPKHHSFSYSYLLVGIPVGWQGLAGGVLAADQGSRVVKDSFHDSSIGGSWYRVDASDYLDRGNGHLGLDGKLRKFLRSQCVDPKDYPYAYLITAPKFWGYSFNPVSFWYLYSADRELTAMILEVNNTFDERRMYFLWPSDNPVVLLDPLSEENAAMEDLPVPRTVLPGAIGYLSKPTRFTKSWAKDFHVSPFNSRKGSYSLIAYDPLYPSMSGQGDINNTITLKSSKSHSKLVARIFSQGIILDPAEMNTWQKMTFLASWWWVGFVTFPRIVLEAGKLFFRRKLHVWFRPEPLKESIGRHADATEKALEACFRNYLRNLVESASLPLSVNYKAAGITESPDETMVSDSNRDHPLEAESLDFKVLTPVFYSRFIHYAHDLEAFFSELNESGTIWLSQPSLIPQLVLRQPQAPQPITNWANYVSFKIIQKLRQRPMPIGGPKASNEITRDRVVNKTSDIRNFRLSAMDGYFLADCTLSELAKYRTQVLKVLLSDRVAFGNIDVLRAEIFMMKCVIAWALAGCLQIM